MLKFKIKNYNEFRTHIRWTDFVSVIICNFNILLIRKYDWLDSETSVILVFVFGFYWAKKRVVKF